MPIRARDLRANIKELGFEQGVVQTLELALEELSQLRQYLRDLSELQNAITTRMLQFVEIGDAMSKRIDQIKRDQEQGNKLDGDNG